MSKKPVFYGVLIEVSDDLELYKALIFQYSVSRYAKKETSVILRGQLITLLAFYFKYGYSRETKDLAAEVLDLKMNSINTMNLDLKTDKYLVEDPNNKRMKFLNPELQELKEYVDSITDGRYNILYNITTAENN